MAPARIEMGCVNMRGMLSSKATASAMKGGPPWMAKDSMESLSIFKEARDDSVLDASAVEVLHSGRPVARVERSFRMREERRPLKNRA